MIVRLDAVRRGMERFDPLYEPATLAPGARLPLAFALEFAGRGGAVDPLAAAWAASNSPWMLATVAARCGAYDLRRTIIHAKRGWCRWDMLWLPCWYDPDAQHIHELLMGLPGDEYGPAPRVVCDWIRGFYANTADTTITVRGFNARHGGGDDVGGAAV